MCCSKRPELSEINIKKPERNVYLVKKPTNNNFSIIPHINLVTERQNNQKEESQDFSSNPNIISNDEFMYDRIDTLKLKNNQNNYQIENINNFICEEKKDGPQDAIKKNISQNTYNNNFNENIITTNINETKSYDLTKNNNFENNNFHNINNNRNNNNEIYEKVKITSTPVAIKKNQNININHYLKNQENNNYQENIINNEIFTSNNYQINNKTEEYNINNLNNNNDSSKNYNKEDYQKLSKESDNNIPSNNNVNSKIFTKPIVNSINNYKKIENQEYNFKDEENKNTILNVNIVPNNINIKTEDEKEINNINNNDNNPNTNNIPTDINMFENINLDQNDNIIQDPQNNKNEKIEENIINNIHSKEEQIQENQKNKDNIIITNYDIIPNNFINTDNNIKIQNNFDPVQNVIKTNIDENKIEQEITQEEPQILFSFKQNLNNSKQNIEPKKEENKNPKDNVIKNNLGKNIENQDINNYKDYFNFGYPKYEEKSTSIQNSKILAELGINKDEVVLDKTHQNIELQNKENNNEINNINRYNTPLSQEINTNPVINEIFSKNSFIQPTSSENVHVKSPTYDISKNELNQNYDIKNNNNLNYINKYIYSERGNNHNKPKNNNYNKPKITKYYYNNINTNDNNMEINKYFNSNNNKTDNKKEDIIYNNYYINNTSDNKDIIVNNYNISNKNTNKIINTTIDDYYNNKKDKINYNTNISYKEIDYDNNYYPGPKDNINNNKTDDNNYYINDKNKNNKNSIDIIDTYLINTNDKNSNQININNNYIQKYDNFDSKNIIEENLNNNDKIRALYKYEKNLYKNPLKNKNSKNKDTVKQIINYTTTEQSQPQISSIKSKNNQCHDITNIKYNSPIKKNEQNIIYNSPSIQADNYTQYNIPTKIENQNYDYLNKTIENKNEMVLSPTKINKPIFQYTNVEKTAALTYSPTKILPSVTTYETINNIKHTQNFRQSRPLPKVTTTINNNYQNLDAITKDKNYNIDSLSDINNLNNKKPQKKSYDYINNAINIHNLNQNKNYIKSINTNPYKYQYINEIHPKDTTAPILNQNYLTTIQNLNIISSQNYKIDSERGSKESVDSLGSSINRRKKYDKLGNPIYTASLDNPQNKRVFQNKRAFSPNLIMHKNNINNNLNYQTLYYQRSLSQDDFNGQELRKNKFNSRGSSPYESPLSASRANRNLQISTLPYQMTNIRKINPLDIEVDPKSKQIINYYLNMDLTKFITFSYDSFKLFYPQNERFFKIPKNEIFQQKEITTYINNNPNLKEKYIGDVNQYGMRHGQGRLITPTSKFIGTFQNGKFSGWGREIINNREVYEGKYNDGKITGKGIYKYKDILYIGDFVNHLREGKGEKITKKYYYVGQFNNNKINGYGRIQFINAEGGESEYEGFFKENNIEGKGVLKWKNGNIYEGEMKNNKTNGQGILRLNNGVIQKGFFIDGYYVGNNINDIN